MIDGDEVLESAQETGYRLCVAHGDGEQGDDDFTKIFSATWDPCNKDRIYVCSQKGTLRVYNIKDTNSRDYRIQFKHYTTDEETLVDGRPISQHWDKMIPIPERPDEFVFLLGVSKNLMYTALPGMEPYPEEPYLSKSTRSDFTGEFSKCLINFHLCLRFTVSDLTDFLSPLSLKHTRIYLWYAHYGTVDPRGEGDLGGSVPGGADPCLGRRAGQPQAADAQAAG